MLSGRLNGKRKDEVMNKKPVSYLQTDPKWAGHSYAAKGETSTIGTAGCGPTSAAMLLSTIQMDDRYDPVYACDWAVKKGYKALNQGTYYAFFKAFFQAHGIVCQQLNWDNLYHKALTYEQVHDKAKNMVKQGYYLIALMKAGNWTKSGHFVVVWDWDDKVRILDPNSKAANRLNGDPNTFMKEVAYYWAIDARDINMGGDYMTQEQFNEMLEKALAKKRESASPNSSMKEACDWAVREGVFTGAVANGQPNYMWKGLITREEAAALIYKFAKKKGLL